MEPSVTAMFIISKQCRLVSCIHSMFQCNGIVEFTRIDVAIQNPVNMQKRVCCAHLRSRSTISIGLVLLMVLSGMTPTDWFSLVEGCKTCLPDAHPAFRLVSGSVGTWCDVGGGALTLHVTKGLLGMGKEAFRATGARSCGGTTGMMWELACQVWECQDMGFEITSCFY